ncbi:MAG: MMPL family transporter [Chloroflexi bacterium]|nr:MMPL family transporter [Chloroflexota bacterium]
MEKSPSLLFERWPRFATRHPWRVITGAVALIVIVAVIAMTAGGEFSNSFSIPGTESQQVIDLLTERFPQQSGSSATVVIRTDTNFDDPAVKTEVEALIEDLSVLPDVVGVVSPYGQQGSISPDGDIARFSVFYGIQAFDITPDSYESLTHVREEFDSDAFQVELGGEIPTAGGQEPPGSSELIGVIAAVIILLIAFGSVIAMGLPIITALAGLIPGFMLITILSAFADMPSFTTQFGAMIGIGVGIDYSLLVVNRFREAMSRGYELDNAIVLAASTAGRSVLFAGSVVVIALLGLWTVGIPFVSYLGTAAAILVACTVVIAVFVLPAVLRLLGPHINRWTIPGLTASNVISETSFAMRWARNIQRRPILFLLGGVAVAVLLALPVLSLRLGSADAGSGPLSSTTRRAYDLLSEGFGPGFNGPILIAVGIDDPAALDKVNGLPDVIREVDNVVVVTPPQFNTEDPADATAAIITVIPGTSPQDEKTDTLVHELRELMPTTMEGSGAQALVGGATAAFIDIADKINRGMPIFFLAVIGLSMLLLAMVFRSVVVPIKAALMILVSVAAAFGVLVAVFQWGWLGGLLGVDSTGPIESFLPMMMFAVLFGLSMDYEVFLVTRMHEEYQRTKNNSEAVSRGQATTMRVILAAAAIMTAVFASFIIVDERVIKEFGIGLATAIFVDAVLVRMVLVPSIMHLVGDRTWWFPKWLDKLLPRLHVEAEEEKLSGAPSGETAAVPGN